MPTTMHAILHYIYSCLPTAPASTTASLSAAADSDCEDHISQLPDELLSNVVSRLPVKDAARTTMLSSRSHSLWASTQLNLDDVYLLFLRRRARRTGRRHCRHIPHLRLPPGSVPLHPPYLQLYEQLRMRRRDRRLDPGHRAKKVEELVFVNCPWPLDVPFTASILRCASLRRLYACVWHFPDTTGLPRGNTFPHLRELGICHTVMEVQNLDDMLSFSPALEALELIISYGCPRASASTAAASGACCSGCPWRRSSPWWPPRAWSGSSYAARVLATVTEIFTRGSRLAMPQICRSSDIWSQGCTSSRSATPSFMLGQR